MPEWLVERGIGETRAILVEKDEIVEARVELDGTIPAGSVLEARLASIGTSGRNAVAVAQGGIEFLLPLGAPGATQGATVVIEVTRGAIPGTEPWKRPLARLSDKQPHLTASLAETAGNQLLTFPSPSDALGERGWNDLVDEARSGTVTFAGGELRVAPTPAMTLIDIDGYLPPDELAFVGAAEAARAVRRLDIGGSIGIDLPTTSGKSARKDAAGAIDAALPQPFERTAVNGFGFVQIIRPRFRASIVELALDHPSFEARALLRRIALEAPGPKRIIAHPAVARVLEDRREWISDLARQLGGSIELRSETTIPMSGGYAEPL